MLNLFIFNTVCSHCEEKVIEYYCHTELLSTAARSILRICRLIIKRRPLLRRLPLRYNLAIHPLE